MTKVVFVLKFFFVKDVCGLVDSVIVLFANKYNVKCITAGALCLLNFKYGVQNMIYIN